MTAITLNVPDVSCGHCKMSIEGAVAGLAGVDAVEVAIEAKTVDLSFDEAAVSLDTIIDAIEDQGYPVAR
jgi:copper chaperone